MVHFTINKKYEGDFKHLYKTNKYFNKIAKSNPELANKLSKLYHDSREVAKQLFGIKTPDRLIKDVNPELLEKANEDYFDVLNAVQEPHTIKQSDIKKYIESWAIAFYEGTISDEHKKEYENFNTAAGMAEFIEKVVVGDYLSASRGVTVSQDKKMEIAQEVIKEMQEKLYPSAPSVDKTVEGKGKERVSPRGVSFAEEIRDRAEVINIRSASISKSSSRSSSTALGSVGSADVNPASPTAKYSQKLDMAFSSIAKGKATPEGMTARDAVGHDYVNTLRLKRQNARSSIVPSIQ